MSTPQGTEADRKTATRIARDEYTDDHQMHTEPQYPAMQCRVCRDRDALRDAIADALAAARAEGRAQGWAARGKADAKIAERLPGIVGRATACEIRALPAAPPEEGRTR